MDGVEEASPAWMLRAVWRIAILLLVGLLVFLTWLVRVGDLYRPGSDFGYNLGLVGGLLMLALLLYPLRKRWVIFDDRFGKMESWFKFHMVAGITGPLLVLFHSTFRTGSINAAAALYSMLLVAASGILGRFIYRHIHHGLYGKQLTLAEATADVEACTQSMGSVFELRPDIEPRMKAFCERAFAPQAASLPARMWKFVSLRWKSRRLAKEIRHDAKNALIVRWRAERGPRRELVLNYRLARDQVDHYLDAVVTASQLTVWERLFSYWHVIHVPFLYLLVFSGVVHVIAVHMY
ncbi:MAG: hypothetical protein ACM3X0_13130 [Bacteroidota bacterium]